MANPKVLITAGCSFTQVPNTYKNWPVFLKERLGAQAYFDGAGSFGNSGISRRVLHRTIECLKINRPEEILVGVMWSGVNRKEIYFNSRPRNYTKFHNGGDENLYEYRNPNSISIDTPRNLYSISPHFADELSKIYYKNIYDEVGALIETLENVLRTQWFLKLNNINYFFTEYAFDCFTSNYKHLFDHPDVKPLIDQIDYNNFLPVENMEKWCIEESNFRYEKKHDHHPTSNMSEGFVNRVIMPHLKSMGYID